MREPMSMHFTIKRDAKIPIAISPLRIKAASGSM